MKKAYQKALLCLHPDKLQQRRAAMHQKYIAEKVFDILQVHWIHHKYISDLLRTLCTLCCMEQSDYGFPVDAMFWHSGHSPIVHLYCFLQCRYFMFLSTKSVDIFSLVSAGSMEGIQFSQFWIVFIYYCFGAVIYHRHVSPVSAAIGWLKQPTAI